MKWLIVLIVAVVIGVWLYRGRRRNAVEDPEVKRVEEQDYYLTPDENLSENRSEEDRRPH
ncbi:MULTISPECIES: hypothetical protein [Marinobacter]|uniref:hypothetical protein n=1 Tax=Marinobacter TaxID=2742 RepID=UPI000DAE2612|nr:MULTISPECIES: hypothetical protein [Marinobacter]